jgi:AraC-like DNA-binding protein
MVVFNFYTLLIGITGVNLIFISFYCLLHKERRKSLTGVFLSFFCIFLALNLLYDILTLNKIFGFYLRFLDEFSLLLAFPCLYFYVVSLTNNHLKFEKKDLSHGIPILFFIVVWVFPPESFLSWNRNLPMSLLYRNLNNIQFLAYIVLIFRILKKNNQVSKEVISSVENGDLKWIKELLVFMSVLFVVLILDNAGLINGNLMAIPLLLFSYWLGYQTINQKDIYYNVSEDFKMETVIPEQNRYRNSKLTEANKKAYAATIEEFMSKEKPFLNNELTLTSMANKLDIKPIHLSQVLNEEFKENFYAFINRYRIVESQRLLKDQRYRNYSIQAIAFEAGFNSMSTFNKAFKEIVGKSPSIYQKEP